jgi:hypothetical protein
MWYYIANNPTIFFFILYVILVAALIWDGWKRKSSNVALLIWEVIGIFSVTVLFDPFALFFIATMSSLVIYLIFIFGIFVLWASFGSRGKRQGITLLVLAVLSFAIPLTSLFTYCEANLSFIFPDSSGKNSCITGISHNTISQSWPLFFCSLLLLIAAFIVYRFPKAKTMSEPQIPQGPKVF